MDRAGRQTSTVWREFGAWFKGALTQEVMFDQTAEGGCGADRVSIVSTQDSDSRDPCVSTEATEASLNSVWTATSSDPGPHTAVSLLCAG